MRKYTKYIFYIYLQYQSLNGQLIGRPFTTPKPYPLYTPIFSEQINQRRTRWGDFNFFEKSLVDLGNENANYVSKEGYKDLPVTPQYRPYVNDILDEANTLLRSPAPTNAPPLKYKTTSVGTLRPRFKTRILLEHSELDSLVFSISQSIQKKAQTLPFSIKKAFDYEDSESIFHNSMNHPKPDPLISSSLIPIKDIKMESNSSSSSSSKITRNKTILSQNSDNFKFRKAELSSAQNYNKNNVNNNKDSEMENLHEKVVANSVGLINGKVTFLGPKKKKEGSKIDFGVKEKPEYNFQNTYSNILTKSNSNIYREPHKRKYHSSYSVNNKNQLYSKDHKGIISKLKPFFRSMSEAIPPINHLPLMSGPISSNTLESNFVSASNSSVPPASLYRKYKEKSVEDLINNTNHSLLELLNPLVLLENYIDFGKKVPKQSNRFLNYLFPKMKVPEVPKWFDMVGNEIIHRNWRVNWVVAPIPMETMVSVNNDKFGFSIMNNIIERQQAVEFSWDNFIMSEYSMLQSQEVAIGIIRNNIGAYVDINKRSRGVSVDILGTTNFTLGVYTDLMARDYGMRIRIRNTEIAFRHDFDDRIYPDPELYATEYAVTYGNIISVAGGIDIPESQYYFSINFKRFSIRAEKNFQERINILSTAFGDITNNRQFEISLESNLPDPSSREVFVGVGMGKRNIAFVTIGAGLTQFGLPQAVVDVSRPFSNLNFGLRLDNKDKYQYLFSTRVGGTSYTYITKIHPENLNIPNMMGMSPNRISNFWKRLGLIKNT